MFQRFMIVSIALGLCGTPAARAATIVWVAEANVTAAGIPYDQGWIDLLTAQGHTVDDQRGSWMTLDAAKIATLEAADLIIVSRTSNSGNYATDVAEVTQWNSVSTPLILMTAFIARNSRWQWINSGTQTELAPETMLQVVKADHPIFTGVSLVNDQVDVIDAAVDAGQNSFITASDVGNGTLIGTRADNGNIWIAEWAPGVPFYSGTTQQPGGKRLYLTGGGGGAQTAGSMNFTPAGQKIFLNAVRYMLGLPVQLGLATEPKPDVEQTDVPRDVTLSWKPGVHAATHDVYLGVSPDDVNDATRTDPREALVSSGQTQSDYTPPDGLEFGRTYYWRVDEVNAPPDSTTFKGALWSFAVEPFAYSIDNVTATASGSQSNMGPEKTIDGSGLDGEMKHSTDSTDMWMSSGTQPAWIQYEFDGTYKLHELWVWNSNQFIEGIVGFGAKDVVVEYSTDGSVWTRLESAPEFSRAPGSPGYGFNTTVSFGGLLARYVRLTINSTWGNMPQTGLSEVRFLHVPVQARGPEPADGAVDVSLDATLTWRPGREAVSHTVYLGTDKDAVMAGTAPAAALSAHSYSPAPLDFGTTYYWRIDEVNEAAIPGVWEGETWSFATTEYATIDDFEDYTDDEGNRIYEGWIDGWTNATGSQVGYNVAPFAEKAIVHGGRQSMPLSYDNGSSPFYSEAEREFSPVQDWTGNGADTLVLYFQGRAALLADGSPGNDPASLYVAVQDSAGKVKVVNHPDAAATTSTSWQPWRIGLSEFSGVNLARVKKMYIGVGDRANSKQGGTGLLYIDDIGFGRPAVVK